MPELPEVETIVRRLSAAITGRTIGRVEVRRRDVVHGDREAIERVLPGLRVGRVERRAKRIIIYLHRDSQSCNDQEKMQLVFHLGMTGRVTVEPAGSPVEVHTHLRIGFGGDDQELRFRDPRRFGGAWLIRDGGGRLGRSLGPVGPEPLELSAAQFRGLLSRRRRIKVLLMDQTVIAGLGNIYCDESLHAAAIHPLRRADSLGEDESARLLRAIKNTLRRAIRFNGSTLMDYRTADGEMGSFQRLHRVYGRSGEPCRSCKEAIRRIVVGGRSTCFCPTCQPRKGIKAQRTHGASIRLGRGSRRRRPGGVERHPGGR
ncbi:MAG: bifunctional DNA-formamidopyrimidine glycosylase/DNA-(apurinic or apyrimidinic site) lyase [Planctomycetota bacterium]